MNILFLCNKSPWPAIEGGSIAMSQLIEGLAEQGHKVKVLALNSEKFSANSNHLPKKLQQKVNIEWIDIDLSIKKVPAFLNLFSNKSYHVQRFISDPFKNRLSEILIQNSYDIVQFETIFMAPYIPEIRKNCSAKIVMRAHNIEHLIWKRIYQQCHNPLKRYYLKHLYKTLKTYELKVIRKPDGIAPISENDSSFFKQYTEIPIKTIPFGITVIKGRKAPEIVENALFHIGSMNWMPNIEGIKWFLNHVWPIVHQKHPDLKFYIAGRAMPEWLKKLNLNKVEVVGEVKSAVDFIQNRSIGIAPLFSGSGIRIKIIESMSLGKALVSTSIGAEGIGAENNKHIKLANTAEEFASAISYLYTHPNEAEKMGIQAQEFIIKNHNPRQIIENLTSLYQQIL